MNKIYRTVYNETTNTWVAVEETAKSHRKSSSGVVDNATAGVSGSLKVRSLTAIAAALAMVSPFMANQAQADVVCQNKTTQALTQRPTQCNNGETNITGTMEPKSWGGSTVDGFNATAWGRGYAGKADSTTSSYAATIKVNTPTTGNYKDKDAILIPYIDGSVTDNANANG
ncbi:MAG: ESPR domain-containing protein, partial [Neisseriaceae bacterium]|nr:ESPR domain-containing protein [Neisseriaceae bacterium]